MSSVVAFISDSSFLSFSLKNSPVIPRELSDVTVKKKDIINLQNGKAGNIYIISHLGSFGEDVFKVGMTRRLNPQDRVNELGDASVPFTDQELAVLWKNQDNPCIEMILIMCYSGFRVSAYKTMELNFEENYFKGGVKTTKSKDRIVPIHSAILPLVKRRMERDGRLMGSDQTFRKQMAAQIDGPSWFRTPHTARLPTHILKAL